MRKYSVLGLLLILSAASALSIDIQTSTPEVTGVDNISINYEIDMDDASEVSYEIVLFNQDIEVLLYNATINQSTISETRTHNVSRTGSGTYELALRIKKPLEYTVKADNNITIQKSVNLDINVPTKAYIKDEQDSINISFNNYGNTDLSISAYFKNTESEITLSPQSFKIGHNSERVMKATINKPESDYTTTLTIITIEGSDETRNDYEIEIINPVIKLELNDVTIEEGGNESTIKAVINNTGNMDVNATIKVRTFNIMEGFQTIEESITAPSNQAINYTTIIPKKDVVSLGVTYEKDGENSTVIQELSPINTIPFDIKLSPERLALLAGVIIVLLIIGYFKISRGRRP